MGKDKRILVGGAPVTDDHREIDSKTGMQKAYVVLSEEERAKGFIRVVRCQYVHDKCKVATRMSQDIAETYAREPNFYSGTYCAGCKRHYPVSEFTWDGSTERVGS